MVSLEVILLVAAAALYAPVTMTALLNLLLWRSPSDRSSVPRHSVSVLIPARNEEQTLDACVDAAFAQGETLAEVLVYNDGSTDGTQRVIDSLVERYPGQVRQVKTHPLREGWAGKPHACQRLAERANGEWLLFIDADTKLEPGALGRLVSAARQMEASMVSAWPRIEMRSIAERLFMPMLNFVVFSLFPAPLARSRHGASLGIAHGACILAHRETYFRLGGHSLVKREMFEDTLLARKWRQLGENSQVLDGRDVVTVRMYSSFTGIWNGFSKNYYPAFSAAVSFAFFQLYMFGAYVVLPLAVSGLVVSGTMSIAWLLVLPASLLPRLFIAVRFRHPLWSALLHPLQVSVMVALGFRSWWLVKHGRGVSWKGRLYSGSDLEVSHE